MDITLRGTGPAPGAVRPGQPDDVSGAADGEWQPDPPPPPVARAGPDIVPADVAVTALYQAQALKLTRLAHLMLGDRAGAEDIVQEAFCGLYRRWDRLADPGTAPRYLRTSVLNGCRSALRRRLSRRTAPAADPPADSTQDPVASAEAAVLSNEERLAVMAAVRRLPPRQREALALRFFLDLPDEEVAATMGIGPGTVRSTTHRALASLARMLKEDS